MTEHIHAGSASYLHSSAAWLVGGFAACALLLGVIGLYGVIAYSVSQRTCEIGVRMALGAERSSIGRLILGEAARLVLLGLVFGIAVSFLSGLFLRRLLFGVSAWDLSTLAAVSATLASQLSSPRGSPHAAPQPSIPCRGCATNRKNPAERGVSFSFVADSGRENEMISPH